VVDKSGNQRSLFYLPGDAESNYKGKVIIFTYNFPPSLMLRWLFLTSVLTASFATFLVPPQESNHAGDVLRQCHGRAWVRAPDMAPGEVIAGDVKIKLIGLCPNAESYKLGLRYKEKISWKLR